MPSVTVRSPAKINLCLGVGPARRDGFHLLATVYQAIDLYDEVRATLQAPDEFSVVTHSLTEEHLDVPVGIDNIAVRAALLLQEHTGVAAGAALAIRKEIPVAGGMAGGSSDAAAALVACNELWGTGLTRAELEPLAAQLGSDVPFLLHGGNAVGAGRGEKVTPVLARGSYHWVVAVAHEGLSTAAVYAEFDRLTANRRLPEPAVPDTLMAAMRSGDPEQLGAALSNDLAEAALSLRPELQDTLDMGAEIGALGALVSGSGPTCLFLAEDDSHATDIATALVGTGLCSDVVQARGPVPGVRTI